MSHLINLQLEGNPIRSIRRDIIQGGTVRIMKTLRERAANANEPLPSVDTRSSFIGENESIFPDKSVEWVDLMGIIEFALNLKFFISDLK